MNKFELDKIMECFGYKVSNIYEVGKLALYHDGRYFTIVNGTTPLKLANIIYEKYDNRNIKLELMV